MKLPDVLTGILPKKEETKEFLFSLYIDRDAAAVAVWSADAIGKPGVSSFAHALIAEDTWEARTHVIDRLLSAAEDKVGATRAITKTVFGMPGVYLTGEGNISEATRPHLKKLSQMLDLTPVGFVPLSQAIEFSLKKDEGVPPSVILVGCSGQSARTTLFRVGNPTHDDTIDIVDDPAAALEAVLKKHQDSDVLPSRILLYGGNVSLLEEVRSKLLKHPWPTRTNFLHFPKIEIISIEALLAAVSLAGASELAHEIGEQEGEETASTVVAQPVSERGKPEDTLPSPEEPESVAEPEIIGHDSAANARSPQADDEELSNVEVVTPETLGFRKEDVLEQPPKEKKAPLPRVTLPDFGSIRSLILRLPKIRGRSAPVIIGAVTLLIIVGFLYYSLPRVTVTVLVASSTVDESALITVDPKATVADATTKIVPGKTQEQSVHGEKTIAVTGKKNIGDPAKGAVTIYNKVTTGRTFSKGTVLTSGGVAFTLDSDVSVASASESIGSITFGKTTANVTARDIGPNGNLSASSEFTFANVSSSQLSARNEAAFTGGTSKQVTVVSRADQDALVKALTDELVVQAKQQLATSGVTGERLIDQTIKTAVTEKVFNQELDEEAKELHGKVTVTVTGVSIADSDVKAALSSLIEAKVPSGFKLAPEQTNISTSNVSLKKDGTMTLTAKLTAVSLPQIDGDALKAKLVGKNVNEATEILRQTTGVAGAEYRFALSPTRSRLPMNRGNITLTVMVQ